MELEPLVASLEMSISIASEFLEDDVLAPYHEVTRRTRNRVGYLGESIIVALAGGTGSGKSSLLNAMAGETVANAGVVRPTTSEALAWLPQNPEPGLVRLLDDMDIVERVGHDQSRSLCVLDMPDTDSVEGAHRATFERLLPLVDAVIWVVDPEKYADRILHGEYLKPLARYAGQFLFVMNQADRLSEDELAQVVADFQQGLSADGIVDPVILAVAADPPEEAPRNIAGLLALIDARWEEKNLIRRKLVTDLARAGESLRTEVGLEKGPLGFDDGWHRTQESVTAQVTRMLAGPETYAAAEELGANLAGRAGAGPLGSLVAATRHSQLGRLLGIGPNVEAISQSVAAWDTRPGLQQVLVELEQHVSEIQQRAGRPFATRLRATFDSDMSQRLAAAVDDARSIESSEIMPPAKGWWASVGVLKWILVVLSLGSAIWWWANPVVRGEWPWPVLVLGLSLIVGLASSRLVELSGRRLGRELARDLERRVSDSVSSGLHRSIGAPMRSLLASRGELEAELSALALEAEKILRK